MRVISLLGGEFIGASSGPLEDGVSVVALHGWARTRNDFLGLVEEPGYLALDLPGFGASPPPMAAGGAHDYASRLGDALVPLVDEGGPVIVVGHSFGGRVGLCLAADRPELVKGLLLIGVPLLRIAPGQPAFMYRVARAANRFGLYSDRRMDRLRFQKGSADYRAAGGVMRDVLVRVVNESYGDELAGLTCPTSFLWGDGDTAAPIEQARRAADLVESLVLFRSIPGAGHDVHLSHRSEVRSMVGQLRAEANR